MRRERPLLQMLILVIPLSQWQHLPLALQSFEILPVSISLSSSDSNGNVWNNKVYISMYVVIITFGFARFPLTAKSDVSGNPAKEASHVK